MNSLSVSLRRDDDDEDTAKVEVEVVSEQFSGLGSAWFSIHQLSQALSEFEAFPINVDKIPAIAGGYWNNDATELIHEHVHISVRPLDSRGNLVMNVKVFSPYVEYSREKMGRGACCDYLLDYEALKEFCEEMRHLISGSLSKVEFCRLAVPTRPGTP